MTKKIFMILFFLLYVLGIKSTYAYFRTSKEIKNNIATEKYVIKLNGTGGVYDNGNILTIINKRINKLPTPKKNGYFCKYQIDDLIAESSENQKIDTFNNREAKCIWELAFYNIKYNLDGGVIENAKYNYSIIDDDYLIPIPKKENYIFLGWTGSNGNIEEKDVTILKGSYGDKEYTANWKLEQINTLIIPVIDGVSYVDGKDGYTFNIWINDELVAENIIKYDEPIDYGAKVRIKTNLKDGTTTNYDETRIIEKDMCFKPTWTINSYNSNFYYKNKLIATTSNKYQSTVKKPNINLSSIASPNGYYLNGFIANESWIQDSHTMRFEIDIKQYTCWSSYGSSTSTNANQQLNLLKKAGFNFCKVNSWGGLDCYEEYEKSMNLYNNAWKYLPKSGAGWSIYKQISCDGGWNDEQKR